MQKALTPVKSPVNDCFADDAVEEAQGTDTPAVVSVRWRTRSLCKLRFADDFHLLGSIEEELQQLA